MLVNILPLSNSPREEKRQQKGRGRRGSRDLKVSVAQIKGSLTLRSCNTSFQTELIYRLRGRFQKARILFPLGWGGGGGGPFIRELCRVIKKRGGCNYVYPPPGPVRPLRRFGRRRQRNAVQKSPQLAWQGLCLGERVARACS